MSGLQIFGKGLGWNNHHDANKDKNVEATLSLDVYFLLPPKTIGKTSDPLREISESQLDAYEKVSQYTKVVSRSLPTSTYPARDNPFDY